MRALDSAAFGEHVDHEEEEGEAIAHHLRHCRLVSTNEHGVDDQPWDLEQGSSDQCARRPSVHAQHLPSAPALRAVPSNLRVMDPVSLIITMDAMFTSTPSSDAHRKRCAYSLITPDGRGRLWK